MEFFQAITDHMLDGVILVGSDSRITYVNSAFCGMSGWSKHELTGSLFHQLFAEGYAQLQDGELERMSLEGQWTGVLELQRPDQQMWIAQITSVEIANPTTDERFWAVTYRDITVQHRMEQRLRLFERIVEDSPDGISLSIPMTPTLTYVNKAFAHMLGYQREELIAVPLVSLVVETESFLEGVAAKLETHDQWEGVVTYRCKDGRRFPGMLSAFNTHIAQGQLSTTVSIVRDLSAQYAAEQERAALQQQVIEAQQAALHELSVPLMPIVDGVLVLPLIGTLDGHRAQEMTETLLEAIAARHIHTVIIDITGVAFVDTMVANMLLRASQAVRLLGARVILTGIRPEVADTLVTLGVTLDSIITRSTLQNGVAYALEKLGIT